jgi:hypothetical protein
VLGRGTGLNGTSLRRTGLRRAGLGGAKLRRANNASFGIKENINAYLSIPMSELQPAI